MTAVSPESSSMWVTTVSAASCGSAICTSLAPEPPRKMLKPGCKADVPVNAFCCGMTVIMIFFVPGITCGSTRSWKPTWTGEDSASSIENWRPPCWFDSALVRA